MVKKQRYEEFHQRVKSLRKAASEHKWTRGRFLTMLLVMLFLVCRISAAQGTELDGPLSATRKIEPPDVFLAVQSVNEDLELLRRHVGSPPSTLLDIRLISATPHDVYFKALTLFNKVNRLLFEITRVKEPPLPMPTGISDT